MLRIVNPSTDAVVGEIEESSDAAVASAVGAARVAVATWRSTPAAQRGAALRRVAASIENDADALARLNARETGKLIGDARGGVSAAVTTIRQYAELGPLHRGKSLNGNWNATDLMVNEPFGVAAVITPWNDPVAVSAGLLAGALVSGNTVVHKPSERAPHVGAALAAHFAKELPDDVLHVVQGGAGVGARLVEDPGVDVIAHVGSTAAGRSVAAAAARTGAKTILENGGNDALIVDAAGDVEPTAWARWAADQAAVGAFANAGQICTSVERIFVLRAVADAFVDALVARALALRPGNALDDDTSLGPLVDRRHREQVHSHITDAMAAGAKTLAGGVVPDGAGAYYPATVLLDDASDSLVWREETFGPVAPVRVVDDFDTALLLADDSGYGLAATVLTSSMANAQRAWRELDVATVKVNAVFGGAPGGAAQPRRASGHGFGYGPELLDEFSQLKVLHLSGALPAPSGRCGLLSQ
ncbi:MAG TPA: aldehyde dehydrogenase family protein [Acidothermaceae bacterium]